MMEQTELASLEYEALQTEKRDKMNARLQVWSLFVALVGAFGLASLQTGTVSDLVALYPFLALCIARYARHSERVLDQIKAYLFQIEQAHEYRGYEHHNRANQRRTSGSHLTALRDAILISQGLAICMIALRLIDMLLLALVVTVIELGALAATWWLLSERKEEHPSGRRWTGRNRTPLSFWPTARTIRKEHQT
jgi:hypothetical protein